MEIQLPHYTILPGIPGSITDLIQGVHSDIPNELRKIPWASSYQGETDYEMRFGTRERLHFRLGKVPWRWSFCNEGEKYWNYASEEEFQRELNGAWGILRRGGSNPANAETLAVFRELYFPDAATGYFDHERKQWVVCEPTSRDLGTESWKRTEGYREFCDQTGLRA